MGSTPMQIPVYRHGSVVAVALVDEGEYERIAQYTWRIQELPSGVQYAIREGGEAGRRFTRRMHRDLLGLARGDGRLVDHINRNGLDNRRDNLRIVTNAQNGQNRGSNRGARSPYRGVYWDTTRGKWRAKGKLSGVTIHIGYFADEAEAAHAAREWRIENMPFANELQPTADLP